MRYGFIKSADFSVIPSSCDICELSRADKSKGKVAERNKNETLSNSILQLKSLLIQFE